MEFKKPTFFQKSKNQSSVANPPIKEVPTPSKINEGEEKELESLKTMFYTVAPVDVESAPTDTSNVIVGEKTGTTMNAQVMMEGPFDQNGMAKQDIQSLPTFKNRIFEAPEPVDEEVEFGSPEQTTNMAEDVIENAPAFDIKPIEIQEISTIDIDIPDIPQKSPEEDKIDIAFTNEDFDEEKFRQESLEEIIKKENLPPLPKHQEEEEPDKLKYEKLFGKQTPVPPGTTQASKVPVYTPDSKVEKLNVNLGKFSVVVRQEYEEYLKSKNPEISAVYKPTETVVTEEIHNVHNIKKTLVGGVMNFFAANTEEEKPEPKTTAEKVVTVDDYDHSDDIESVAHEINGNLSKLKFQTLALGLLTAVSFILTVVQNFFTTNIAQLTAPIVFASCNLLIILAACFVSRVTIQNGLVILKKFKGNSDTAVAVACIGSVIAGIGAFFSSGSFLGGKYSYYTIIVLIGLLCNALGKLIMVKRVKKNFKFLATNKKFTSAKIYTDETIAAKMMSGTVVDKPIIAYQHKTGFLTNFLQLSYAPDPSEEVAGKIAPFTTICAVLVAVLHGIISKDIIEALSTLALITAVSIPICSLMAVNVPMYNLCKKLLRRGTMLCGFQGVKQFCDTSAIMVDAKELYPECSVILNSIKSFNERRLDDSCVAAAAVLKEVGSPLAPVFNGAIQESRTVLPDVESVMYEDQLGLVGWVNGERILVGNRDLMTKYGINVPNVDFEETYRRQHKQTTFIAHSGQLSAMLITTYRPNIEIAKELKRAEYNGISLLISTTDCNITSEQIAEDFGVFYRSVKVLPTGLGNVCKEVTSVYTEKSRGYLATKGRFTQLARALSGSVQMKSNISLAVIIQLIGVVLGVLIMSTIVLYTGTSILGTVEMLLYTLFWGIATMIAPAIKRP
jgi:cation transport ATPase